MTIKRYFLWYLLDRTSFEGAPNKSMVNQERRMECQILKNKFNPHANDPYPGGSFNVGYSFNFCLANFLFCNTPKVKWFK